MKRSLLFKLILCYIICISFFFLIANTFGSIVCSKVVHKNATISLANQCEEITELYIKPFFNKKLNPKSFSERIRETADIYDETIWFINSKGNIIIDTEDYVNKGGDCNILKHDEHFLSRGSSYTDYNIPDFTKDDCIYAATSISNGDSEYHIAVLKYTSSFDDVQSDIMLWLNILVIILCPIIALIFILIYFLTIHPVHKITKAATEYSKGHFNYPLDINANDEYNELGTAIKYMAGEMNNLDVYQRKFIGNISHDFRSPLTSIKGYLQAMLDGTIPKDNQEKYMNIILFEAERLSGLMTNLLTLNSFDHKGRQLDRSNFDINSIISQTTLTYEGVCEKKKIEFEYKFETDKLIVWADQPKIQQVLNNLIDNAIKFSPHNSKITISTYVRNEKIFVSVKDRGIGIPSESINRIWERFYKSDSSRGKDKKGTGLGLAITKEIITSHEENIDVISTEGVGSEFIFTLPPKHMSKVVG